MASRIYIKYAIPGSNLVEYYELGATEKVENSIKASPTRHKVEGGATISDHRVRENEIVRLTGVISNITKFTTVPTPTADYEVNLKTTAEDYIAGLKKADKRGDPLTVVFGASGESLDNCVIISADFSRDSTTGDSYEVRLVLEQLRFSPGATVRDTGQREEFNAFIQTAGLPEVDLKFNHKTRTKELSVTESYIQPPLDLERKAAISKFEKDVEEGLSKGLSRSEAERAALDGTSLTAREKGIVRGDIERQDFTTSKVFLDDSVTEAEISEQVEYWLYNDIPSNSTTDLSSILSEGI